MLLLLLLGERGAVVAGLLDGDREGLVVLLVHDFRSDPG